MNGIDGVLGCGLIAHFHLVPQLFAWVGVVAILRNLALPETCVVPAHRVGILSSREVAVVNIHERSDLGSVVPPGNHFLQLLIFLVICHVLVVSVGGFG